MLLRTAGLVKTFGERLIRMSELEKMMIIHNSKTVFEALREVARRFPMSKESRIKAVGRVDYRIREREAVWSYVAQTEALFDIATILARSKEDVSIINDMASTVFKFAHIRDWDSIKDFLVKKTTITNSTGVFELAYSLASIGKDGRKLPTTERLEDGNVIDCIWERAHFIKFVLDDMFEAIKYEIGEASKPTMSDNSNSIKQAGEQDTQDIHDDWDF